MIPSLDTNDELPLYEQLSSYYKKAIQQKQLPKGTRMPSVRKLAADLRISKNTVVKCYEQLVDEGYIENKERKGLFVGDIEMVLKERIEKTGNRITAPSKSAAIKYNLGRSVVDEYKFPMRAWRKAQQQALDFLSFQYVQYDFTSASAGLREQLVSYLYRYRGVQCSKEQIIIAAGCNTLYTMLALFFKKQHKKIIFEEPGFEHARDIFLQYDYEIETIDVDENGIVIPLLEGLSGKLIYLTPCHQYPTGAVMPVANRKQLLLWAANRNAYIIEDDYDSIFRHKNKPVPALQGMDENENVIYIGTFSKLFIPSLRVAYMVLPRHLVPAFNAYEYLGYTVPYQTQRALAIFLEEGQLEKHMLRMQKSYRDKYFACIDALKKVFAELIVIRESETGLSILIEIKTDSTEDELISKAREHGIAMRGAAITWFHPENRPEWPRLFIGFGNLPVDKMIPVLTTLRTAWFSQI